MILNLSTTPENVTTLACEMQTSQLIEFILLTPNMDNFLKQLVVILYGTITGTVNSDRLLHWHTRPVFFAIISHFVYHAVLAFSP